MNFFLLAMQFLPYALQAVVAVEGVIGSQSGTTKKAVVMSAVLAANQVAGTVPESHVKVVSALIDTLVGGLNAAGVFGKTVTTAPEIPVGRQEILAAK